MRRFLVFALLLSACGGEHNNTSPSSFSFTGTWRGSLVASTCSGDPFWCGVLYGPPIAVTFVLSESNAKNVTGSVAFWDFVFQTSGVDGPVSFTSDPVPFGQNGTAALVGSSISVSGNQLTGTIKFRMALSTITANLQTVTKQ